jgi:hypothetical protein
MPAPLPSLDWLLAVPLNELQEAKKQLTESIETWKGYQAESIRAGDDKVAYKYEDNIKDYSLRLELVNKALDIRK